MLQKPVRLHGDLGYCLRGRLRLWVGIGLLPKRQFLVKTSDGLSLCSPCPLVHVVDIVLAKKTSTRARRR